MVVGIWKTVLGGFVSAAVIGLGSLAGAAPTNDLAILQKYYVDQINAVDVRYSAMESNAAARFGMDLDALGSAYQRQGVLAGVLAVKKTKETWKGGSGVDVDDKDPKELKALKEQFNALPEKIKAERNRDLVAAAKTYEARLTEWCKILTMRGNIEEATAIQAEIDALKATAAANALVEGTSETVPEKVSPGVAVTTTPPVVSVPSKENKVVDLATYLDGTTWTWEGGRSGESVSFTKTTVHTSWGAGSAKYTTLEAQTIEFTIYYRRTWRIRVVFDTNNNTLQAFHNDDKTVGRTGRLISGKKPPETPKTSGGGTNRKLMLKDGKIHPVGKWIWNESLIEFRADGTVTDLYGGRRSGSISWKAIDTDSIRVMWREYGEHIATFAPDRRTFEIVRTSDGAHFKGSKAEE